MKNYKELYPLANKHEIDMLECKYGSYAKYNLLRDIEAGNYKFGTMT